MVRCWRLLMNKREESMLQFLTRWLVLSWQQGHLIPLLLKRTRMPWCCSSTWCLMVEFSALRYEWVGCCSCFRLICSACNTKAEGYQWRLIENCLDAVWLLKYHFPLVKNGISTIPFALCFFKQLMNEDLFCTFLVCKSQKNFVINETHTWREMHVLLQRSLNQWFKTASTDGIFKLVYIYVMANLKVTFIRYQSSANDNGGIFNLPF